MNDEVEESNGESKTNGDNDDDDSEEDVFGVTTVVDLKKHQVWNCNLGDWM